MVGAIPRADSGGGGPPRLRDRGLREVERGDPIAAPGQEARIVAAAGAGDRDAGGGGRVPGGWLTAVYFFKALHLRGPRNGPRTPPVGGQPARLAPPPELPTGVEPVADRRGGLPQVPPCR